MVTFGNHRHSHSGDIMFSICHITILKGYMNLLVEAPYCKPPSWSDASGNIDNSIFRVTLQDHDVIEGSDTVVRQI